MAPPPLKKQLMHYAFRLKRNLPMVIFIGVALVLLIFVVLPAAPDGIDEVHDLDSQSLIAVEERPPLNEKMEYCRKVALFLNPAKKPVCERRTLSIVYVTKRPGGYDMLFRSLAKQTNQDYELICIDELAAQRGTRVAAYAQELGVHLVDIIPSKPKTWKMKDSKFGIYKALNTGLLLTSGSIVTILMDFAWVPERYVERTIEFYKEHPKSFLAYPELFWSRHDMQKFFAKKALEDANAVSLWKEDMMKAPHDMTEEGWFSYFKRPEDVINRKPGFEKQKGPDMFWEMSFASAPWSAFEELNGVEEELDVGDDCHEVNMRLRAEMFFGYDLWIDGQSVVDQVEHRSWKGTAEWNRFAEDANWSRYMAMLRDMQSLKRPVYSMLDFNLSTWRQNNCRVRAYGYDMDC